jgi:hypothetical protein
MTAVFSPALAPATRPGYDDPFEFPACRSLLYTGSGTEPGPRACAVSHGETGGTLHGSMVGGTWSTWTDADAARSLADFGPRPAAECTECPRPARAAGLCGPCFTAADRDDNHTDTENIA